MHFVTDEYILLISDTNVIILQYGIMSRHIRFVWTVVMGFWVGSDIICYHRRELKDEIISRFRSILITSQCPWVSSDALALQTLLCGSADFRQLKADRGSYQVRVSRDKIYIKKLTANLIDNESVTSKTRGQLNKVSRCENWQIFIGNLFM